MTAIFDPTDILSAAQQQLGSQRHRGGAEDTNFPDAQIGLDSQRSPGVGDQTTEGAHVVADSQKPSGALGPNFPDAHGSFDSQMGLGVGEPNLPQPSEATSAKHRSAAATNLPDAQRTTGSQIGRGVGDQAGTETAQRPDDSHTRSGGLGPILADPTLALAADVVDDLERVKIANQNRLRTLTMDGDHGHGMSVEHPDVKRLAALVKLLVDVEHQATLNLARVMRHHPLGEFVKNSKGIGEKQAARLLASIGDPYWNDLHNRPRRLRELNRFCGVDVGADGVAPSKQRGERVHWSPDARMRLWNIAIRCVMNGHGGPYRAEYEAGREKYADAVHSQECKRCGPKGKPALPGSPLSAGHQNARAIRLTMKKILRDLWTESKRLHTTIEGTETA